MLLFIFLLFLIVIMLCIFSLNSEYTLEVLTYSTPFYMGIASQQKYNLIALFFK